MIAVILDPAEIRKIINCLANHSRGQMMRCKRTAGSGTNNWAAHAGFGSQTAGLVQAGGADSRITAAQRVINALGGIHLNGLIGGSPDAGAPLLLVALPRKRETAGFLTLSDIPADSRAFKPATP